MIYESNSKPYPNHRNIFLINLLEIREHANMLRIVDMRRMPMKKMKCSNCGRRAFDISKLPKEDVEVTLKCPQCGKFVSVPCNEQSEIRAS